MVPPWLVLFFLPNLQAIQDLLEPNLLKTYFLKNLLDKYTDYQAIYHFDNLYQHRMNNFIKLTNEEKRSVLVHNYNSFSSQSLKKPTNKKSFNLIGLPSTTPFQKYLSHYGNNFEQDVAVFVLNDNESLGFYQEYRKIKDLDRVGKILVVDAVKVTSLDIYELCYFCGKKSGKLTFLQTTNNSEINLSNDVLFPKSRKNFYGHRLKIGHLAYYPMFFCSEKANNVCRKFIGTDYELLKVLGKQMNFTFKLIEENSTFTDLVTNVKAKRIDIALGGISINPKRFKYVDFTTSVGIESVIGLVILNNENNNIFSKLLMPFATSVWVCILLVLSMMALVTKYYRYKREDYFFRYFFKYLKNLVEQMNKSDFNFHRKKPILMLLAAFWFLFLIQINASYKSRLASLLINPPKKRIPLLQDLLNGGFSLIINTVNNEIVQASDLKTTNIIYIDDICESVNYWKRGKSILVHEFSAVFFHIKNYCKLKKIDFIENPFFKYVHLTNTILGWPVRKGTPFLCNFNDRIEQIRQGGFLEKWKSDLIYSKNENLIFHEMETLKPLLDENLYRMHFWLYCYGVALSILVFLIELITSRRNKRD